MKKRKNKLEKIKKEQSLKTGGTIAKDLKFISSVLDREEKDGKHKYLKKKMAENFVTLARDINLDSRSEPLTESKEIHTKTHN